MGNTRIDWSLEENAKKIFSTLIIVISIAVFFLGSVFVLKELSAILIPISLMYISALILKPYYKIIKYFIRNSTISFIALISIVSVVFYFVIDGVVVGFMTQSIELKDLVVKKYPDLVGELLTKFPEIQDFISLNIEQLKSSSILKGDIIDKAIYLIGKILSSIGSGAFSLSMAIVTWIVIPTFMYYVITSPLEKENIQHVIPVASIEIKESISIACINYRDRLEVYFSKQLISSIIQTILLFVFFKIFGFNAPLALSLIVGILNLIPNLGSFSILLLSPAVATLYGVDSDYLVGVLLTVVSAFLALGFDNILFPPFSSFLSKHVAIWNDEVHLHPVVITFSIIFWGFILDGMFGLILSVPITILVQYLLSRGSLAHEASK